MFRDVNVSILDYLDVGYREALLVGRRVFNKYVTGVKDVTALSLYNGLEYRVLNKRLVYEKYLSKEIDFLIISGGYGIVHGFEKIRDYNVQLNRRVLRVWLGLGLDKILANYIVNKDVEEVYGFFTRTSNYRAVYYKALKIAKHKKAYIVEPSICLYPSGLYSLRCLGQLVNNLLEYNEIPRFTGKCTVNVSRVY